MTFFKRSLIFTSFFIVCIFLLHFQPSSFQIPTNGPTSLLAFSSRIQYFHNPVAPRFLSSSLGTLGRLGNHIFEFASLYGLSKQLNRTPVFWIEDETYREMLEYTRQIVPGLVDKFTVLQGKVPSHVVPTKFHPKSRIYDNPERLKSITDEYLHLTGHFYQSWKYFPYRRDEIRSYLKPQKEFKTLPESDENIHVTCIHTRRTDFVKVGFYASDPDFVRSSVQLIQQIENLKHNLKLVTVMFGDDPQFMKDIFPGAVFSNVTEVNNTTVHFISSNSPSDDLLYSSQHCAQYCDTVLISAPSSTFGWWLGYLSKGNRVFFLDVTTVSDGLYKAGKFKPDDYFLPEWTALKFKTSPRQSDP